MPSLTEIKQKRAKKPFKKRPYRTWDLSGDSITAFEEKNSFSKDINNSNTSVFEVSSNNHKFEKLQIENEDNIKTPFRQQSDNNQKTIRQQQDNSKTIIGQQLDNKTDNIFLSLEEDIEQAIKRLSGLQEKLFYFILEQCNLYGELQTEPIKTENIAVTIGCSYRTAKIVIERLVKKGVIKRLKGKKSAGGFVHFKITKEHKIIGNRLELQKKILDVGFRGFLSKIRQQLDNKLDNNESSSSNININNTTTVTGKFLNGWEKINYDSLKNIGFSDTQLLQLQGTKKCNPEVVQESINYLAFDLEQNGLAKKYADPLNVFMGVMREGKAWRKPKDYESPQDKALRELLEEKKKAAEERKRKIDELFELHFDEWYQQQPDDFLKSLLPDPMKNNFDRLKIMTVTAAKEYFRRSSIWENIISKFVLPNCI